MKKSTTVQVFSASIASILILTACETTPEAPAAPPPPPQPTAAQVLEVMKASFAERGIAKLDRLDQNEIQKICSDANMAGKSPDNATLERLQKAAMATVKYPADGNFIGDWREGERVAQSGRGMQFSDAAGSANGANCYACHQVGPTEISYGNQGPSLLAYGKNRGVKDPKAAESEAMVRYTWQRIYNTHAVNACSNMPRFGDAGILTEKQLKDVMALLLDPASPVNR